MELSDQELKEFKEIFERDFNQEFSEKEVRVMEERLIGFLKLIYRPLPEGKELEEKGFGLLDLT